MEIRRVMRACAMHYAVLFALVWLLAPAVAAAQADAEPSRQEAQAPEGEGSADARFEAAMAQGADPLPESEPEGGSRALNLLRMASPQVGGVFLYPIYGFSFVVVLFGIERAIGLRRNKVMPRGLVKGIDELNSAQPGFDPRKAYRLCQKYPSAAATVMRAALLKTGRPTAELERAVAKASEHEAERLYANVRPLNLSATVAPLLGLIGTVQGMIIAFYRTAYLPDGANKAQALAEGVYIALVTTFAGLCVAIPAVCLAHFFEGKIQRLLARVDELIEALMPSLERYEGKLRVIRPVGGASSDGIQYGTKESEPARKPAATPE